MLQGLQEGLLRATVLLRAVARVLLKLARALEAIHAEVHHWASTSSGRWSAPTAAPSTPSLEESGTTFTVRLPRQPPA